MVASIETTINKIAIKVGVNRNALERLIYNESRGNPNVGMNKSNYSAGIAQLSSAVWHKYTKLPYAEAINPNRYELNIMIGAKYLKENYRIFGNWTNALMGYNMGTNALLQAMHGQRKIPKITQQYVKNFQE